MPLLTSTDKMMAGLTKKLYKYILLAVLLVVAGNTAKAYSILAHEAVIDASWRSDIVPLLKKKYPSATYDELLLAHSYAYGGSIVADMGYMPFGNGFFTDLVHYVRSGDFIETLISESQNLNEYAFSLGALSHYMADKYGHSLSTNRNVPIVYPKLKKKFGDVVTYDDDHTSHSRMEFAYDVLQVGQGNYTSEAYRDFIGFNMAVPVLERAFYKTYGQKLNTIFSNINSSINMMRWGVRNLFPALTKNAYKANRAEIEEMHPGITVKKFRYKMSRRAFNLQYGKERKHGNFFSKLAAGFISILPKIGPLKTLNFKSPGEEGQRLFAESFEAIVKNYKSSLNDVDNGRLVLPDIDFDTGHDTHIGEYPLADKTWAKLVETLQKQGFKHLNPPLQQSIASFYNASGTPDIYRDKPEYWAKLSTALQQMKAMQPIAQADTQPGDSIQQNGKTDTPSSTN
ncbi:zinc dependent phospholipase C family protein [Mucilaginibacter pallidiroseus]|uniref:Zinc dependent phospholipase C family protein n=1 Tax=Mucilaginibacter pallidiroseus TaxID=2599295 RepID=A0A563U3I2_9SPHI|nr:zinc dependent phospholipase C family protein [Mucilaginibacter pallidiroseus]